MAAASSQWPDRSDARCWVLGTVTNTDAHATPVMMLVIVRDRAGGKGVDDAWRDALKRLSCAETREEHQWVFGGRGTVSPERIIAALRGDHRPL